MDYNNEDYIKQIINSLKRIDYIKPEDIPNIDLYMDQVTTFMDEHLQASKRYPEDKMLTKTMINNYTKNNLLPSPDRKKYSKEHMLLLIFIYYFKNILSISDIQSVFNPLTEKFYKNKSGISLEEIYTEVFSLEQEQIDSITKDIIRKFSKSKNTFPDVDEEDREFLTTFSFICMLSFDVYIKKTIIEKLIDKSVSGMHKKKKSETTQEPSPEKNGKTKNKEFA
jgi:predicted choloylglycine hydrolase